MPRSKPKSLPTDATSSTDGARGVVNFPPAIAAMLDSKDPAGSQSKQAFVKEIVVPHRKFKEAINAIAKVHNAVAPAAMVDAEFSLISGRSRAGKSTAVRFYANSFKSYETSTGMKSPVVYLEAPSECTVLSLLDAVLGALKVPKRGLKTRDDKTQAIVHHLREQGVQLLIVDEYQHFIDQRTNRFQYAAGNLLKSLLNTNACQMIFAGLLSSDSAITINDQAEGRLNSRYEMGRYVWQDTVDKKDFLTFLFNISDLMPFARRFAMEEEGFAIRIYVATDGLVGRVMVLVAKATAIAADRLANSLAMADFAAAFDAKKQHGVTANPFRGSVKKVQGAPQNLMDDRPDEDDDQASRDDSPQDWPDAQADADPESEIHSGDVEEETLQPDEDPCETEWRSEGPEHGVDAGTDQSSEPEVAGERSSVIGHSVFPEDGAAVDPIPGDDCNGDALTMDIELSKIDELLGRTRGRLEHDHELSGLRSAREPRVRDSFSKSRA